MSRDSLGDGYVMPEEREGLMRSIGRMEGMMTTLMNGQTDIRMDLQSMAEVQEKATARTLALEMRVESLERWQMLHNQHCLENKNRMSSRSKLLGAIALVLLVPALGWVETTWKTISTVLNHVYASPRK